MSNVVTLAVFKDNKNGFPATEESHAKQMAYNAFKRWHKRAMDERDGIVILCPSLLKAIPCHQANGCR